MDQLWARQAFIDKLMVQDISSNTYIQSTIGNWTSSWMFTNGARCWAEGKAYHITRDNTDSGEKLNPADISLIMDSAYVSNNTYSNPYYFVNRSASGSIGGSEKVHLIHGKAANAVMGDGSAKGMIENEWEDLGWPDGVFYRN